jgi:hypothetical protein
VVKWQTVRHQVAIAGRLADAGTGKPVGGALVSIAEGGMPAAFRRLLEARAMQYGNAWMAMTERPDRTRTAADGIFYFLDLPDGDYTLSASLPRMGSRYGAATVNAMVSSKPEKKDEADKSEEPDKGGKPKHKHPDYERVFVELVLRATTVHGKIIGANHKNGVAMAEVRVKGSGERTFSDTQGHYVLAGIEPIDPKEDVPADDDRLKRTITVLAQGYQPKSQKVALNKPGEEAVLDFELVREVGSATRAEPF